MKEVNVSRALSQASLSEVGGVLRDHMCSVVKESLVSLTLEEAALLSRGGFYHPDKEGEYSGAGSAKGSYNFNRVK